MKRGRTFTLLLELVAAGVGSWALYYTGSIGAAAALRLGGGLCAGLVLLTVLPALWPGSSRGSALEEALDAPPPAGPGRPRSLRDLEMTVRLACSKQGGRDVYYRLRPVLRPLAEHRLRARGVGDLGSPAARELLGEELWQLVRPDAGEAEQGNRGLSPGKLAEWVETLESL